MCQLILKYIKPTNKISLTLDPEKDRQKDELTSSKMNVVCQFWQQRGTLKIEVDGYNVFVDMQGAAWPE